MNPAKPTGLRPALQIVIGLAIMVAVGTLLLLLPFSATRSLSISDAAFTAVSALSVTGLSVITPALDLTVAGQVILLLLIQAGGVGYMVLAVTAFRMLGRHVSLADRLALQDSLGLLSPGGLIELIKHVLRTVLFIEAVGAILLWLHWRTMMPDGKALWYAVFHSVSAFCNAGFNLFSGHPEHMDGFPIDNATLAIIGLLIFLGGVGIPVLFDFATYRKRHDFSLHTRITVPVLLTLVVVGAIAFYLSEGLGTGVISDASPGRAAIVSIFQSISCRSGGFVGVENFDQMQPATLITLASLMFIGSAPASMGGGITTGTFAVMVLALVAYARGRDTPIFKGRAIPGESIRKGAAVLTISIFLVTLCTWLIALTHDQPLDRIGFEVVSAFSTCGLSLGLTSELNEFGRAIVMFMMFWGRLGALTILVGLAKTNKPRLVHYPEEKILIG